MRTGSISTSEGEQQKRKRQEVQRYGYDDTDEAEHDTDEHEREAPRKKLLLKRSDAMFFGQPPVAPFSSLGSHSATTSTPSRNENHNHGHEMNSMSLDLSSTSTSETLTSCHCPHVQHWSKEMLRILLRLEEHLTQGYPALMSDSSGVFTDIESVGPAIVFPTSVDSIFEFFKEINNDDVKRLEVICCVCKEVSKGKKKSVQRIILRVSSPSVWKHFSKNGQRGKLSAIDIGLPTFIVDVLRKSKVSCQQNRVPKLFRCWYANRFIVIDTY